MLSIGEMLKGWKLFIKQRFAKTIPQNFQHFWTFLIAFWVKKCLKLGNVGMLKVTFNTFPVFGQLLD